MNHGQYEAHPEPPALADVTLEETRQRLDQGEGDSKAYDRLIKLRRDVANGLLDLSRATERDARRLMSAGEPTPWPRAGRRVVYVAFLVGLSCGFGLAIGFGLVLLSRSDSAEIAATAASTSVEPAAGSFTDDPSDTPRAPEPISVGLPSNPGPPTETPELQPRIAEGLQVTLTALEQCWVRVQTDSEEEWERLMEPEQTFTLDAAEHTTLRIGDAGALSILINGQAVKQLGESGQVLNLRIAQDNYQDLLVGSG